MRTLFAASALALVLAAPAVAQIQIEQFTSTDQVLSLGSFAFQGGKTLNLTVGIGSGGFRRPSDPAFQAWVVGDRGPNIACSEAEEIAGVARATICAAAPNGRIYPTPDYTPSAYGIRMLPGTGRFVVTDVITVKDKDGVPVDGMLNPLTVASTETPLDGAGKLLQQNPNAVDLEGIVRLRNGEFWFGDENGPSLIHTDAEGRIITRYVPAGTEQDYARANYRTVGSLPALLAKRATNRGLESLTISPDERFLWTIMQNPVANPDAAAYRDALNARILQVDRATGQVVGQFVYQMEPVTAYKSDTATTNNTVRISEMLALSATRFIVLERTERTTKLYEIDVSQATNILGTRWDDPATRPTLEQSNNLAGTGITPTPKVLRLDTADHPSLPVKIEGLAMMGDGRIMLINDDDFGITGGRTIVSLISGTGIRLD